MTENKDKLVRLDKRYRVCIDNDDLSETPVMGFETGPDGLPTISEATLIDYGPSSETLTWVVSKFYEHNNRENLWNKFFRKELDTNVDWKINEKIIKRN